MLYVGGNWANNGTFNAGSGTVVLRGSGAQSLSGANTFNDLAMGDIANGLVGYWKFDEGSGNSAADASGNGNNGTFATWGPGGSIDWTTDRPALQFSNASAITRTGTAGNYVLSA